MKNRVVNATEFKAKCLALLDEVDQQGGTITITKRGRATAVLGPAPRQKIKSSKGAWKGKLFIPDDVLMADTSDLWDCVRGEWEPKVPDDRAS